MTLAPLCLCAFALSFSAFAAPPMPPDAPQPAIGSHDAQIIQAMPVPAKTNWFSFAWNGWVCPGVVSWHVLELTGQGWEQIDQLPPEQMQDTEECDEPNAVFCVAACYSQDAP